MSFLTRYIGEYQTEIWRDLSADVILWTSTEITRCVERAVDDLSRFYPLEAVYEHTILFDPPILPDYIVAPAAGTWKDLTYKPIEVGSDTVTSSPVGTTYTRDTDYTIDYMNGRITIIAAAQGGGITAGSPLLVDYTISKLGIDISAIITSLIRIVRVEYPADMVPQQFPNYHIWNDFLYIGSQKPGESQTRLTDKEHVVIYYEKMHTAPLASTAPSYPAFLDQVICIGAAAYALLMKAIQYEHQAVTDLAAARNQQANISHTATVVALNKIAVFSGHSAAPGAKSYLVSGDDFINTVNIGNRVPENYADYARAANDISTAFLTEAMQRNADSQLYLANADGYVSAAAADMTLSDRFRAEGLERRNEFWSILRDKAEYRKRLVSVPVHQPPAGPTTTTRRARTDQL